MLEVALPFGGGTFAPKGLPANAIPQKAAVCVDLLLQCYWIGLVAEAKPMLESIVDWMQQHAPPDPALYTRKQDKWLDVFYDHYSWWRTLGLATWLLGRGSGAVEFGKALDVELDGWRQSLPDRVENWRESVQYKLSEYLAVALGAGRAVDGLHVFREAGTYRPHASECPVLKFGRWACEHLASGKSRDADFVRQGEAMLKSSMMSRFFLEPGGRTDPALWLKAIYFDSGVTKTAEETMLRVYDFMPGVTRPDFVPRYP